MLEIKTPSQPYNKEKKLKTKTLILFIIGIMDYRPLHYLEKFWISFFPFGFIFHLIDVTLWDFYYVFSLFFTSQKQSSNKDIKTEDIKTEDIKTEDIKTRTFSVYSCRSGFDLVLQALNLSDQDEIIMTGLNIVHMGLLPQIHHLTVRIADLDLDTLEPDYHQLKQLVTPQTRALVFTQLFGAIVDLTKLGKFCHDHNLILIEDCAQSLSSIDDYRRDNSPADFSIYSFGLSKNFTAFGGGLLTVRNQNYESKIREILDSYPIESRWNYFKTVIFSLIKVIMSSTLILPVLNLVFNLFGSNFEDVLNKIGKEFSYQRDDRKLLSKFRKRCCFPHRQMIQYRMKNFKHNECQVLRKYRGDRMCQLIDKRLCIPGRNLENRYYWLFPVLVNNRDQLLDKLRSKGFFATKTATSFGCIYSSTDHNQTSRPRNTIDFANRVVYLPYSPVMPLDKMHEMIEIVNHHS